MWASAVTHLFHHAQAAHQSVHRILHLAIEIPEQPLAFEVLDGQECRVERNADLVEDCRQKSHPRAIHLPICSL